VTLFVSRGPKLISVPVVVGSQRETAVQRIRSRGLEVGISEEESSEPKGRVIQQSPDAGSRVEPGATVAIVVSSGEEEETAEVPNVIGNERREAVEAIRAAGLTPAVEEEETEVQGQIGRVLDQFPPPGRELEPGTTVTITVGRPVVTATEEEGEEG
jgi:eukaryotic-like serine/threonine-protein kinase